MDCAHAKEEFSALLDGELTPEDRAAIEAHLAECSECLRDLDGMKRVDVRYRQLAPLKAPEGLEHRVRAATQRGIRIRTTRALSPLRVWPLLASAASLALVIGAIAWTLHTPRTASFKLAESFEKAGQAKTAPAPATSDLALDAAKESGEVKLKSARREAPAEAAPAQPASAAAQPSPAAASSPGAEAMTLSPSKAPAAPKEAAPPIAIGEAAATAGIEHAKPKSVAPVAHDEFDSRGKISGDNAARSAPETPPPSSGLAKESLAQPDRASEAEMNAPTRVSDQPLSTIADSIAPGIASDKGGETKQTQAEAKAPLPMAQVAPVMTPPAAPTAQVIARKGEGVRSAPRADREENAQSSFLAGATGTRAAPSAAKPEAPRKADAATEATKKTVAGRTFELRDGVWIQQGYELGAATPTKVLRESRVLKGLTAKYTELPAILDLGDRVIVRLGDQWYRVEPPDTKPR
ncbi:MAG: zf-HC2 domain-containing protein [Candidatus Hydrogenedentes bacterium]|nr:zf-HC2 domain-containing protein [Candidatus Hydrogenedentota bacterium]